MKGHVSVSLICLSWLLLMIPSPSGASNCGSALSFFLPGCIQPVHCQWGPYGEWSDCDGCTRQQSRSRAIEVFSQFGGNPCGGVPTQSRDCETTRGCPLKEGCGGRFRCRSGKCVSMSLVCNGDQDCEEDNKDELSCPPDQTFPICHTDMPPPNVEEIGLGFDVVTGKRRGSVINTKSFGGQCRTIFSGDHKLRYRLPQSTIRYSFDVKVQNDFSDEFFDSSWSYSKDIVNRETTTGTTTGFKNYDYHETEEKAQTKQLLVIQNDIELVQFQNTAPAYLPLGEEFWKALSNLPSVYDYSSYRKVLERFGTHYPSEGVMGGSFKAVVSIDQETAQKAARESSAFHKCIKTKHWLLFISWTTESCDKDSKETKIPTPPDIKKDDQVKKVYVHGGGSKQITAVEGMTLDNPANNWRMYKNWVESVRDFPEVIKQKLVPLSELVKEMQCSGVKKIHMRRAIEQYVNERHPCHCKPCRNNGLAVMDGDECKCICKPGTKGTACEKGKEVEGQEGVIHGSWTCWSGWTSCSRQERSRTRSCTNPSPLNGGQHCIGESTKKSACNDEEDLEYYQTIEPQCFDLSLPPKKTCETPPPLPNGFVLDPKDGYVVGNKIEYTCIEGYHLIGIRMAECSEDQTWSRPPKECKSSRCGVPSFSDDVIASLWQTSYDIGEKITFSCPDRRRIIGDTEIICDSSLNWSPNPKGIKCSEAAVNDTKTVQCQPWEKLATDKCVCKLPYECASSLKVCSSILETQTNIVTVCQMHALQCLGKSVKLLEDSACQWPDAKTTPCTNCQLWETCDEQTSVCRCKESAECSDQGMDVCVRVGGEAAGVKQTMSECEAGRRRCEGETLSIVSILPCET